MSVYIIYAIVNPTNEQIVYIGKTKNLDNRKKTHLSGSHNNHVYLLAIELKKQNLQLAFIELDRCDKTIASSREAFYINKYGETNSLYNGTGTKNKLPKVVIENKRISCGVTLLPNIVSAAQKNKSSKIRGGFSAYIEKLIINDLDKSKIEY